MPSITRYLGCVLLLIGAVGAAGSAFAADPPKSGTAAPELFGLTRVTELELRLTAEAWESMQPSNPPRFGPGARPFAGKPPSKTKPDAHRTMMGMEYPIVHATLKLDRTEYPEVALRFKGNFTYQASAGGLARPFRVDLNRFVKGRSIGGVTKFSLNNNVADPSRMREALAYEVFRQAKVPTPRTGFARVTLTVPGRFDHRNLGVYTLVEAVDERFLKAQFGSDQGLLLKPQFQGVPYLGEEWPAYVARFGDMVKGDPPAASTARYIALARLVNQADDDAFRQKIATLLDVDEFLRFLAANALLVNLDSFLAMGQNYYLYDDPKKSRFYWLPWDLDLAFGAWPMGGPPEQQADLSLLHPYAGENRLIERLLSVPEHRATYLAVVGELVRGGFSVPRLNAQLEAARPALRAVVADEGPAALHTFDEATGNSTSGATPQRSPLGMPFLPLRTFFRQRVQSVTDQLAGKRTGYVVRPGAPGMGDSPGKALSRPLFGAADRDRNGWLTLAELGGMLTRWLDEWDSDRTRSLDPAEMVRGLNRLFGFPPGGSRAAADAGQELGGPGGFLGPRLFQAIDTNRDGRATAAELGSAAREWLPRWDRDRDGLLSPEELGDGLSTPEFAGGPR